MEAIIRVQALSKTFAGQRALNEVALNVAPGEMVALLGPSGSGKSTLLRHLSGLMCGDKDSHAHVELLGRTIQQDGALAKDIRRSRARIGYIFQQFNLVNRLTVLENVLIGTLGRTPLWRSCVRWFTRAEKQAAFQALQRVGMDHYAEQRVSTLSGGQQQRVAIARALMQQAEVILADEPIASLDPESARIVMDILQDINRRDGITVVVTLHQVDYARRYCERVVALRQGNLFFDCLAQQLDQAQLNELYASARSSSPSSMAPIFHSSVSSPISHVSAVPTVISNRPQNPATMADMI